MPEESGTGVGGVGGRGEGIRPSLLPVEVQVANISTHHDAGGRAGHTGVSGGADAPRGGKRLLERARRWRSGHARGCEGVGVGLALGLRMGWGGETQRAAWRWPPGGAGDSRADLGEQRSPPWPGVQPAHLLQTFHAAATGRPLPRRPVHTWRGQTSGSARLLQRGRHTTLWCPHPSGLSGLLTAGGCKDSEPQ